MNKDIWDKAKDIITSNSSYNQLTETKEKHAIPEGNLVFYLNMSNDVYLSGILAHEHEFIHFHAISKCSYIIRIFILYE
jgi:hypothetical protein